MKTLALFGMICLGLMVHAQQTPAQITREALVNQASVLKQYPDGSFNSELHDSIGAILFRFQYTAAQQEGVADDEYTEQLTFTIIADKSGKFTLSGKQLETAHASFYKGCFCANRGTFPISSGTIKGTRMSKTEWYININVKVKSGQQTITKKIKGYYKIVEGN